MQDSGVPKVEIGIERNAGTETLRFETVSKNLEG